MHWSQFLTVQTDWPPIEDLQAQIKRLNITRAWVDMDGTINELAMDLQLALAVVPGEDYDEFLLRIWLGWGIEVESKVRQHPELYRLSGGPEIEQEEVPWPRPYWWWDSEKYPLSKTDILLERLPATASQRSEP